MSDSSETFESFIKVINDTNTNIINTTISEITPLDWFSPPDFNGVLIPANSSETRSAVLHNYTKSCPFTLTLSFEDNTHDVLRINQLYALKGGFQNYQHALRSHEITTWRSESTNIFQIKSTPEQLQNQEAQKKIKQGQELMNKGEYKQAVKLFDEASELATSKKLHKGTKRGKTEAALEYGKVTLQKALDLEKENDSEKAQRKFERAKIFLEEALKGGYTGERHRNLAFVKNKIRGNELVNEGIVLEEEALKLFDEAKKNNAGGDYDKTREKYLKALAKYEEAKKYFEECLNIDEGSRDDSAAVVEKQICGVKGALTNIDKAEVLLSLKFEYDIPQDKN